MEQLIERFLKYVKIDTQSDDKSETFPSTPTQVEFAKKLVEEMKAIGLQDVELDENGYTTATLPANIDKDVPVIGFIAHVDTSPDFTGKNVNPKIVEIGRAHV